MFENIINSLDLKGLETLNQLKAVSNLEIQKDLIILFNKISIKPSEIKNFNYLFKNIIIIHYIFKTNFDDYCQSIYNFLKKYLKFLFNNEMFYSFKNDEYYNFGSFKNELLYKYDVIFYCIKLIKYYNKYKNFNKYQNKFYFLKIFNLFLKYNLINLNDENIFKLFFKFISNYINDIEELSMKNYILVKYELIKFLDILIIYGMKFVKIIDKYEYINKKLIWNLISKIGNYCRLFHLDETKYDENILKKLNCFKNRINSIILLVTSNFYLDEFFDIIIGYINNLNKYNNFINSLNIEQIMVDNNLIINNNQNLLLLKYNIEKILDNEPLINLIFTQLEEIINKDIKLFLILNLFNDFKKNIFILKSKYKIKVYYMYYKLLINKDINLAMFSKFFDYFVSLINDIDSLQDYVSNFYLFYGFYIFIKNNKNELVNNRYLYNKIKKKIILYYEKIIDDKPKEIIIDTLYFLNNDNIIGINKNILIKNYDEIFKKIIILDKSIDEIDKDDLLKIALNKLTSTIIFNIFFVLELYLPLNWDESMKNIWDITYYKSFFEIFFKKVKNDIIDNNFIESVQYMYLNKIKINILNQISLKYENILFHNKDLEDFMPYIDILYKLNKIKRFLNKDIINLLDPFINKCNYYLKHYIDDFENNTVKEKVYILIYKLYSIRDNLEIKDLNNKSNFQENKDKIDSINEFIKIKNIYTIKIEEYFHIYNTDLDSGFKQILKNETNYKNILSLFLTDNFDKIEINSITNKFYLILIELLKNPYIINIDSFFKKKIVSSNWIIFFLKYYFNAIKFLKTTNNYNNYYKIQSNMFIWINKLLIRLVNLSNEKIESIISEYTTKVFVFITKSYYYEYIEGVLIKEYIINNKEFSIVTKEFFKFLKILLSHNNSYKLLFIKNLNLDFEYLKIIFKNYKIKDCYTFNLFKNEVLQCIWYLTLTKDKEVAKYLDFNIIPENFFDNSCYSIKEFYNNKKNNEDFIKINRYNNLIKTIRFTFTNNIVDDNFNFSYNKLEDQYIFYSDQKIKFKDLLNISSTLSIKKQNLRVDQLNKDKEQEDKIKWINYHSSNLNIAIYSFLILLNLKSKSTSIKNFFKIQKKLYKIKTSNFNIKRLFYKHAKNFNLKNDPAISIFNKTAIYKFLNDFIISIEIIDEERHFKVVNFMKPNICFFYTKFIKNKFLKEYDISSRENRLYSLINYFDIFKIYCETNKTWYNRIGYIFRLKQKEQFISFGLILIWIVCIVNVIKIYTIDKDTLYAAKLDYDRETEGHSIASIHNDTQYQTYLVSIRYINKTILGLSIIFLIDFFFSHFYYNYKIEEKLYYKNNKNIEGNEYIVKLHKFLYVVIYKTIFSNDKFLALLIHLIFALFWTFTISKITLFTTTFHLFTIIFVSDILKKTMNSIFSEFFKILITFIFIIIFLIFFAYMIFFSGLIGYFQHFRYCKNLNHCLSFNLRYSFFDGSGIYSYIKKPALTDPNFNWISLFEIIFFLLSKVVIGNIIQAIILDSFSININAFNYRNKLNINECFICSITNENYDSKKKNLSGHINNKHSIDNYFFYYVYLFQKNKKYFTKTEKYIYDCIIDKKIDFFPWRDIKNNNQLPENI